MTPTAATVDGATSLQEAATLMERWDVGMLGVEMRGELIGVVTDRDIAIRGVAEGADPRRTAVVDVMTEQPQCCAAQRDVYEAAQLMRRNGVRRLPVIGRSGRVAGVVSAGDLARSLPDVEVVALLVGDLSRPERQSAIEATSTEQGGNET